MNHNILITGAAGGLGRALALEFAGRGAQVMLVDRNLKGLERVCDEIETLDGPAPAYCQLDLLKAGPQECEELLSGLTEAYGELDSLVHCAARFQGLQPMDQVAGDEWLTLVQINLNAAWLLSTLALPSLRKSGGALLFTLHEEAARGDAYWGPYGVSKAGLRCMAGTFAEELEGTGVRVHGVDPGPMRTSLRATAFHSEDPDTVPEPAGPARQIAQLVLEPAPSAPVFLSLADS
ncbi:MAG: SDR family NAD(P)-dependent oxidoreductase [Deinococcales bacterium]